MTARRGRRGGRRWGCAIAGALLVLLLLGAGGVAGLAWLQVRTDEPRLQEIAREVPDGAARTGLPDGSPAPRGRVEIDAANAELIVEVGPAGAPIGVAASYDHRRYELSEETLPDDGSGWVYRVALRPSGWRALATLRMKLGGRLPSLRVRIPRDVAIDLAGRCRQSFVALELGGSNVRSVALRIEEGWGELGIDEPLPVPMERVEIDGLRGALSVSELGNASPRSVRLQQSVGTLRVDLRGGWTRDAAIEIDGRFVGGMVRLPRDARVEGLERRRPLEAPRPSEMPPPTLHVRISGRAERLVVVDPDAPSAAPAPAPG